MDHRCCRVPVSASQVIQRLGIELSDALPKVDGEGRLDAVARGAAKRQSDAGLRHCVLDIDLDSVGQGHIGVANIETRCSPDNDLHMGGQ